MKRLIVAAVVFLLFLSACGPDNPFAPDNPSVSALTGTAQGSTTAKLAWNACPDSDFASYTLYRSSTPGIQSNSGSATLIVVLTERGSTSHLDENLEPGSAWYYALKVANEPGGTSWSNEAYVKLPSGK